MDDQSQLDEDHFLWIPPHPDPRTAAEALANALSFEFGGMVRAKPEAWLRAASGALLKTEDQGYVTHKWDEQRREYIKDDSSPTGVTEHRVFAWGSSTAHSFAIAPEGVGASVREAQPGELRERGTLARGFDGRAGNDLTGTATPAPSVGAGDERTD